MQCARHRGSGGPGRARRVRRVQRVRRRPPRRSRPRSASRRWRGCSRRTRSRTAPTTRCATTPTRSSTRSSPRSPPATTADTVACEPTDLGVSARRTRRRWLRPRAPGRQGRPSRRACGRAGPRATSVVGERERCARVRRCDRARRPRRRPARRGSAAAAGRAPGGRCRRSGACARLTPAEPIAGSSPPPRATRTLRSSGHSSQRGLVGRQSIAPRSMRHWFHAHASPRGSASSAAACTSLGVSRGPATRA